MTKARFAIILILSLVGAGFKPARSSSQDVTLVRFEKIRSDPQLKSQLEGMVRRAVQSAFGDRAGLKPAPTEGIDPLLRDPFPAFITAKKGEKVRGCMGSLETRTSSLETEIQKNLKLAFTQDPRHPPIQKDELVGMEIFITAVGTPKAVQRLSQISPARDGLLIRSGNREAVVLPGEAKTTRYLLAFARAKAGIKRGVSYQVFQLPTATMSMMIND